MKYWQKINNIHLKALSVALPILFTFLLFKNFVLALLALVLVIGGIGVLIYFFISWAKDFKNRKQPKIDDRDPIVIAIENCQTREELPDFCIMLQNLPPSFSEKYFWVYVGVILYGAYIIYDVVINGIHSAADSSLLFYFFVIMYLLKHWNNLHNEHEEKIKYNKNLANPHLQVTRNGIIYFDGVDDFCANWEDVVDIGMHEENRFAKGDIVITTNSAIIKINGYYETISIYNICYTLYHYWFIIKNNRRQLKIT